MNDVICVSGSRGSSEHQSSASSSLRLSDEHDKKSPPSSSSLTGSYLRRLQRRRSDCTETGSIGYGSSAPLESETSYSSHPGYPSKPACTSMTNHSPKSVCSAGSADLQVTHQQQVLQRNQQVGSFYAPCYCRENWFHQPFFRLFSHSSTRRSTWLRVTFFFYWISNPLSEKRSNLLRDKRIMFLV